MASISPSSHIQILFLIMNSTIFVHSWCFQSNQNTKFKQKSTKFWEFQQETKSWVEINLPYDLKSCVNKTCTKVGSIETQSTKEDQTNNQIDTKDYEKDFEKDVELPIRRVSLNRMSESSVWVTGQSGSIFERFWNGVQWVIAPHELPSFAGFAVSTFFVNQTILSLSENGVLYRLQLNENSQPVWSEILFVCGESNANNEEMDQIQDIQIKSGAVSHEGKRLFLASMNGSLIEISEFQPFRWENHGRPSGGDVASISDTGNIKSGVLFIISSTGDLYEFDKESKPAWKKHISTENQNISLKPRTGSVIHGLFGAQSISLFLINKDGFLVERRLHRRKWKWTVHRGPQNQELSSITPMDHQNRETDSRFSSLFFMTTSTGSVFEYQLPIRQSGGIHENEGIWINHNHPNDAKIAQSITGVQLQIGRTIFPLDDGRLVELHLPGLGGSESSPNPTRYPISTRKKQVDKYEWSIVDTPESEGWNSEFCTEYHGPMNCILGSKSDMINQVQPSRRIREEEKQWNYISTLGKNVNYVSSQDQQPYNVLTKSIESNFRMRMMHQDRSLFHVSQNGLTFEYLLSNGVWIWLRHEHESVMKGAVGSYNGSLYLVDFNGNLLIRERIGDELTWINCTGLRKGRHVASGPPWDGGKFRQATSDDSLFFVNKKGKLIQFTVALRAFTWKDCQSPPDTKIAFIADQEILRRNIIFAVGRNNRLYQYNKISELWHQHSQSPHLMLSLNPGTAMRPHQHLLSGSLFMVSVHGGLVEYRWTNQDRWEWVEHGGPNKDVGLVGTVGPSFDGTDLFVIGLDGLVYRRNLDGGIWRWVNHGYPNVNNLEGGVNKEIGEGSVCNFEGNVGGGGKLGECYENICNEKVAAVRPIPFSDHSVIFELQDGRLGELRRPDDSVEFEWSRIIGTPTSKCMTSYWTAVAT